MQNKDSKFMGWKEKVLQQEVEFSNPDAAGNLFNKIQAKNKVKAATRRKRKLGWLVAASIISIAVLTIALGIKQKEMSDSKIVFAPVTPTEELPVAIVTSTLNEVEKKDSKKAIIELNEVKNWKPTNASKVEEDHPKVLEEKIAQNDLLTPTREDTIHAETVVALNEKAPAAKMKLVHINEVFVQKPFIKNRQFVKRITRAIIKTATASRQ